MVCALELFLLFFLFDSTAPTEIYTLSLHDALPICPDPRPSARRCSTARCASSRRWTAGSSRRSPRDDAHRAVRSEEHTSELQSRQYLVCRLLLEKKKTSNKINAARPS